MNGLDSFVINSVGFLNDTSERDSIARLGQSALDSGVSSAATAALVRLTCQAHGINVGASREYLVRHLEELSGLSLIWWAGTSEAKLV
ncbi:hypothetical protein SEA_SATIS_161 [Streptomyces phage Satis]|nr:hypothetical protein SEA_SATIS_161 [Streptomyces phage Satis]QBZ72057.1 hypothetical protein SEA_KRADAL_161 [Streptomyces phage Kradal]QPL14477.1 hypothetical protein SEA_EHYELIMAYOE_162 [Streptomyces phage EhyElimayoE]